MANSVRRYAAVTIVLRRLELARAETLRPGGSRAVNSGHALAVALLEEPDLPEAEMNTKLEGLHSVAGASRLVTVCRLWWLLDLAAQRRSRRVCWARR